MCSSDEMPKEFEILTGIHGCKLSLEDCNSQMCSHFFTCEALAKALRQATREAYEDCENSCKGLFGNATLEGVWRQEGCIACSEAIRKRKEERYG